jgi:hypothetical protein
MKTAIANLLKRPNRNKTVFEVEEELQFHIEMLERKYAQHGMSGAEARAAAVRRFGNFERVKKQCVDISRRNTVLLRVLKISTILIGLIGLAIQLLSTEFRVGRIGRVLIMIAVLGRLLLYVRGLSRSTFLPGTNQASLSVVTDIRKNSSNLRQV